MPIANIPEGAAAGAERYACPAAGPNPTVKCPLKPTSLQERPTLQRGTRNPIGITPTTPDGKRVRIVTDARIRVRPPDSPDGVPPKVCRQESITIHAAEGAKTRQSLRYGTSEHTTMYNLLRQSQEGLHGFAKDNAHEDLGAPGKRRVRGKAAQSVFAAFLLAAASIRKIRTFMAKAITDPVTGERYVVRLPRTGDHATTDLPPGGGPRQDPTLNAPDLK